MTSNQRLLETFARWLIFLVLALAAFWVLSIRVGTAIWIGPFTLNAYLTGVAALASGLLAIATLVTLPRRLREQLAPPATVFMGSLALLPFLVYSAVALLLDFRIEGFQNTLVLAAFSLSVAALPFWLRNTERALIERFFRISVFVVPTIKIVSFLGGFDFYGEASYAIVAVVLLAWAASQPPKAWFDYAGPWLLLASILTCNVRTAAVVAIALMLFVAWGYPLSRGLKVVAGIGAAGVAAVLVWIFVGNRFATAGDRGFEELLGEDSPLAAIGTTRRAEGWLYLLDSLPSGINWFGQGPGLSSYLIDELLQIHHPHNEYLRIFFDYGIVGLALFLVGALAMFISVARIKSPETQQFRSASLLVIPTIGLMAVTDNPLVFAYVMVPAAVILACALSGQSSSVTTVSSEK